MTKYFAQIHAKQTEKVIAGKVFVRTPEFDLPYKKGTAFTFMGEVREAKVINDVWVESELSAEDRFFAERRADRLANVELLNRVVTRLQKLGYELIHTSESGSRYLQLGEKIVRVSDHFVQSKDGLMFVSRWTKQIVSEVY